jgi:hypothetical protein
MRAENSRHYAHIATNQLHFVGFGLLPSPTRSFAQVRKRAGIADEKIAVANGRDLGDAPITFDERATDRPREIGEGFLAIDPRARP